MLILLCSLSALLAAPYKMHSTACDDETSYAAALHKKLYHADSEAYAVDEMFLSVADSYNEKTGACNFVSTMQLKFTSTVASDRVFWSPDFNRLKSEAQFLDASVVTSNPEDEIQAVVWRWDSDERIFEIGVKSQAAAATRDMFTAHGPNCRSPIPLIVKTASNPRFKCMRLSYYPDTCERALKIGPTGRKFAMQLGILNSGQCAYHETKYEMLFTQDIFGTDEEDRTFHIIRAPGSTDLEQIYDDPEMDVYSFMELSAMPPIPGDQWAYRTSRGDSMKNGDVTLSDTNKRDILQITAKSTVPLTKALQEASRSLERIIDPGVFQNEDSKDSSLLVWTLRSPDGWRKCTDEKLNELGNWLELITAKSKVAGVANAQYCLKILPNEEPPKDSASTLMSPCAYFRAQIGDDKGPNLPKQSTSINSDVFVTLGKDGASGSTADCSNAEWVPPFVLKLKRDHFGRSSGNDAWRMAEPSGSNTRGQPNSWTWRVTDTAIEIAYKEMFQESQELFVFQNCEIDNWRNGMVMRRSNSKQTFDCLKVTLTPDVCEHAIGLENRPDAYVLFEVALAATIGNDQCEYDTTRAFGMAFTNEPVEASDSSKFDRNEQLNWKRLYVANDGMSHPHSWMWASRKTGAVKIAFEVGTDPRDSSKTHHVEFNGEQACEVGRYPNLRGNWEMRSSSEDAPYACIKLSTSIIASSDHFKQSDAFEILYDLQSNPNGSQGKGVGAVAALTPATTQSSGSFGMWMKSLGDVKDASSAKAILESQLSKVKLSADVRAVTGEHANLFTSLQHGDTTHYMNKRLPLGHPNIDSGKLIHTIGMHTRAVFVRNPRQKTQYSGLFAKENVPLLIRYSPSSVLTKEYLKGWAFKFFREGALPTDDLVTYNSFKGVATCDAFTRVTNAPLMGDGAEFIKKAVVSIREDGIQMEDEKAGDKVNPHGPITSVAISHLCLSDENAWGARNRHESRTPIPPEMFKASGFLCPKALVFIPDPKTVANSKLAANIRTQEDDALCLKNREKYMTAQLGSIKPGTLLFHVYAFDPQVQIEKFTSPSQDLLGTIITEDVFIPSWYGNAIQHFKHEPSESDLRPTTEGSPALSQPGSETIPSSGIGLQKKEDPGSLKLDDTPRAKEKKAKKDEGVNAPKVTDGKIIRNGLGSGKPQHVLNN